jgi:hypothetical protein
MTDPDVSRSDPTEDADEEPYRRLAAMDPPALRSLAGELERISDESLASSALETGPAAQAKARRDAQRSAAAQAALASLDSEDEVEDRS